MKTTKTSSIFHWNIQYHYSAFVVHLYCAGVQYFTIVQLQPVLRMPAGPDDSSQPVVSVAVTSVAVAVGPANGMLDF